MWSSRHVSVNSRLVPRYSKDQSQPVSDQVTEADAGYQLSITWSVLAHTQQ